MKPNSLRILQPVAAMLALCVCASSVAAQLGSFRAYGQPPAVHHLYQQARAVVIGTVLSSDPWRDTGRRDGARWARRFRLDVDDVVRGVWSTDKVELELWRYEPDLDLEPGVSVLCFLDHDDQRGPALVGAATPALVTGSRQALAYRVAFRALDELLRQPAGSDRRAALLDWVLSCIEREPTRHLGLHDLTCGALTDDGRKLHLELDAEAQERLLIVLDTADLSSVEERVLLGAVDKPWLPRLRARLVEQLAGTALADASRTWTGAEEDLLIQRLDVLAVQRRLAREDTRGWPERRNELAGLLREPDASGSAPYRNPAAAAALVAEVLGPPTRNAGAEHSPHTDAVERG